MEQRSRLDVEDYPFFEHSEASFFLARRENRPVGRIAAIENRRHNEYHDEQIGFFGFFDVIDDSEVAGQLLDAAGDWASDRGLNALRGPANYSSNETWGVLVEGFDRRPSVMMPYHPPYVRRLLDDLGFDTIEELIAYETNTELIEQSFLKRVSKRVRERNDLQVRRMDLSRFNEEARVMRDLFVDCWSDNWGFIPPTEEEFLHTCEQMKPMAEPELSLFVEDGDQEIAFIVGIPDPNEALQHLNGRLLSWRIVPFLWQMYVTGLSRVRVVLLGVKDEYQGRGLETLLIHEFVERGTSLGYRKAELSWVLASNDEMNRVLEKIGVEQVSRYDVCERRF